MATAVTVPTLIIDNVDPDHKARELGVMNKHSTEKACASHADVFTTVSDITSYEAERLLGQKPDTVVYNGIDMKLFPDRERLQNLKPKMKENLCRLAEMVSGRRYLEEMEKVNIFFTSGRYEFHNKGIDMFIDALKRLDDDLKDSGDDSKVIAFFFIPNGVKEVNAIFKENKEKYRSSREVVVSGDTEVFSTHDLIDDNDQIMVSLREKGLTGSESNVRCILVPVYLNHGDEVLDTKYYDIPSGCDLGVFTSSYEPWGYTPQESLAVGTPTITSDLAGFGRYVEKNKNDAVDVIPIKDNEFSSASELLKDSMKSAINRKDDLTDSCLTIAESTQWKNFVKNYIDAYNKY